MNKQQLANRIWESANKMRSKIEANEYKDYILGFIFYKYLSDYEVKYLKEKADFTDDDIKALDETDAETTNFVRQNIGYFIEYNNLFSTWLSMGSDFNVSNVHDALSAFNRLINDSHKIVFTGIFDTLQTGLSKLGDSSGAQTKAIINLLDLIKDIPMDGKQDYDVLGFIYEYLISNFAANAGKKAGEFYTPHEVSLLMSEIVANHLRNKEEIKIYDPTSGSGSLLINIGRSVSKHITDDNKIKYYAQELKENTYNLTRMNLIMRGISADNIVTRCGDTLEEDWPYFDETDPVGTYEPLYVDAVVSNPPYSQQWDPANKDMDARFAPYGLAPKGKADYAFLLHDLYHLKPDGIMTIVLPHGVLFRGGEEGTIRRNLIENNNIDAIIGLPANIFFGTGIPTIIMVLKQKRENTDVLIIDASKGFEKVGKNNKLRASDIKRIADTVIHRSDIEKYSRKVSREEIRENDYNLNIPRYVDSSEKAESWDIYASMFGGIPKSELNDLNEYWETFHGLKEALFEDVNDEYCICKVENLKEAIMAHPSVQFYKGKFDGAFTGLDSYLHGLLIDNMAMCHVTQTEEKIAGDLFYRFENIDLIDPYEGYEILDRDWQGISGDLEILQTEGMSAATQVDPNMVTKKKNGKDVEVQDGWVGHVLPFELVQNAMLQNEVESIRKLESRLNEITSEYEEQLENLSEEDKEQAFVNEDKTAFVFPEIKKAIKAKAVEEETLTVLEMVSSLNDEEKKLKKQLKNQTADLQKSTKETIENLSSEEVNSLLHKKWVDPLVAALDTLPTALLSSFISTLDALNKKYASTFSDIETQIQETEKELSTMLDQLVGSTFDMQGIEELKKMLGGEV